MIANLTNEQCHLLAAHANEPLRLVDPESKQAYVLLPAEIYERLKGLLEDDYQLRETYPAQFRAAFRAGWDDPQMDDYANYEENYRKSCQSNEATSS
jgi:hypothetical protein